MNASEIELVRPWEKRRFAAAMFDFDGTLSLMRGGWLEIMTDMVVELVQAKVPGEHPGLHDHARTFLLHLNGKPAINQMQRLADEVTARGGTPETALDYLKEYDRRLLAVVGERQTRIDSGAAPAHEYAIPGSQGLLDWVRQQQLPMFLASGTELRFVQHELKLLGLHHYFGADVYAPEGAHSQFTKRATIEQLLTKWNIPGSQLISFGDGMVETAEVKRVGGIAIGVASREDGRPGCDPHKRELLIQSGADAIIPHYLPLDQLTSILSA